MASIKVTGRAPELARLRTAIERARVGRTTTVLVRGEPGIGKSAVLEAVAALAGEAGFQVAAAGARGVPDRPFAAVGQILGRLLATSSAVTAADGPPSPELLWKLTELVRAKSRHVPVAICLDDISHLDPWSLRWVLALSGSVFPTPLVIAVSEDDVSPVHGSSPRAELAAGAEHIRLTGLPPAAVIEFAANRCGVTLGEESAAVCHELTGGNPGLLLALLSERAGTVLTAETVRATSGSAVLLGSERWLADLGEPALELARAVAVLGADAEITWAAELARLTVQDALSAIDELVDRCLLANRTPLTFRHPLLATMVVGAIPVGTRTALHLRAAEILRDGHFGMTGVARQLVAAGPLGLDWAVRPMRIAARQLAREGRAEDAARHLRGVLRERLRPRVRSAVRRELAELDAFVDPDLTVRQLEAARQEADDPEIATDYAVALAALLTECGRPVDAVAVLDDTAERLGPAPSAQSWRLRLHKAYVCLGDPAFLAGAADRLEDLVAERPRGQGALKELAGLRAAEAVHAGADRAAAVRHARQALAGGGGGQARCFWHGCVTLIRADELTEAWAHCGRVRLADGARPGRWDHVTAELLRAMVCRVRGDLAGVAGALAPMADVLRSAAFASHVRAAPAVSLLAEARALMGDTDAALALLGDCGLDRELPWRQDTWAVLSARAVVWECAGELPRAVEDHLAAGRLLAECQVGNPSVAPWRSRAARLLAAAGETGRAARLAGAELDEARRWGTPRAIGIAEHAVAMAESGARRIDLLATAAGTLARSPARLELAAARCDLGTALAEAGRLHEARIEFDAALSTAESCGARPLARRIAIARQEIRPADIREPVHPNLPELTPQELKILCLARDGHTNRAIAGKLFVTVRTVEFHLSGAYRKLGISGRQQLAQLLPETAMNTTAATTATTTATTTAATTTAAAMTATAMTAVAPVPQRAGG
ncbi:AAA family ATPase [Streptomyces pathocidini]|uniref:helix-turn-helix transcriptional regulator n=1 Tax=Streptomyces pathocidini TaxID=1650571 RepID=UPI0033FCC8E9